MNDLKKLIYTQVHLHLLNDDSADFNTFIDLVVADVFAELKKTHSIPMGQSLSDLREDLKEEVIESTRKKIYGYHDVKQYRKARKKA